MIPVFFYCIWFGKQFLDGTNWQWSMFFFLPTLFLLVALYVFALGNIPGLWKPYLVTLWLGLCIGLFWANRLRVKVDLLQERVLAPKSWFVMICLLSLCITRCAFDVLMSVYPEYANHHYTCSFAIKGWITGLLYGQALSFLYRFIVAKYCKSDEMKSRFVLFYGLSRVKRADCY